MHKYKVETPVTISSLPVSINRTRWRNEAQSPQRISLDTLLIAALTTARCCIVRQRSVAQASQRQQSQESSSIMPVAPEAQLTTSITSMSSDCSTSTGACPRTPPTAGRVPVLAQVNKFSRGVSVRITGHPTSSPRISIQWPSNNSRCVLVRRHCFRPGLSPEVHSNMHSRPLDHSLSTTWLSRRQPSQRGHGSTRPMVLLEFATTLPNFRKSPHISRSG